MFIKVCLTKLVLALKPDGIGAVRSVSSVLAERVNVIAKSDDTKMMEEPEKIGG